METLTYIIDPKIVANDELSGFSVTTGPGASLYVLGNLGCKKLFLVTE